MNGERSNLRWIRALRIGAGLLLLGPLVTPGGAQEPAEPEPSSDFSDQPYVWESISLSARFESDGTGEIVQEARARVYTEAGVQQLGQILFPYVAGRVEAEVESFYVESDDGARLDASTEQIRDVPAPITTLFPVFTDLRLIHVTPPALRPGNTLSYRFVQRLVEPPAPGRIYFEHRFVKEAVVLEERVTFDLPDPALEHLEYREGLEPEVTVASDRKTLTWRRRQLEPEPPSRLQFGDLMPRPDVELSSFGGWKEVGAWYRELQTGRATPDDTLSAKASELVAGIEGDEAQIRAIYDFVTRQFRYSALLFGMTAYQAHPAAEVLSNGYGDCKDKHTLLEALLAAVGYEAAPVLISALREQTPEVPSPLQFDHVITRVDLGDRILWMDSTAQTAPFGYLAPSLRGKQGLLIPKNGEARLADTPAELPFDSSSLVDVEGEVDDTGKFSGRVEHRLRGDDEYLLRSVLLAAQKAQWNQIAESVRASAGLPRGEIGDVEISDATETLEPLRLEYSLTIPSYLDPGDPEQSVKPLLPKLELPEVDAEVGELNLDLPTRWVGRSRVTVSPHLEIGVPVAIQLDRTIGQYVSSYERADGKLVAERSLTLADDQLDADQYRDYGAFRKAIQADLNQTFAVVQRGEGPSPAASGDISELMDRGRRAIADEDWTAAAEIFSRVTALDDVHPTAWHHLGRALTNSGDATAGVEAFERQLELDPFHESAHKYLAWALAKEGRVAEAEAAYRKQLDLFPLDRYAAAELGELLEESDRCEEAVPFLVKAISLKESDEWSRLRLARCRLARNEAPLGLSQLKRLGESSSNARLVGRAAKAAYSHKEYEAALPLFERHRELSPESADYALEFAVTLARAGRMAEGLTKLRRLVQAEPDRALAWDWLGYLLIETGEEDQAIEAHRRLLELEPDHVGALKRLGRMLLGRRDLEEAIAVYEKLTELEGAESDALIGKAWALAGLRRFPEAIQALETHVAARPDNASALKALGDLYAGTGRPNDAVETYRQLVRLAPEDPGSYALLGRGLFRLGLADESKAALETAIGLDPGNGEAQMLLGRLASQRGDYRVVVEHLERAQKLLGDDFTDQDILDYARGQLTDDR